MKRLLVLILLICSCYLSNAQKIAYTSNTYPGLNYRGLSGTILFKSYMQTKGSPYLNNDWLPGKLFLEDGDTLNNLKIRFDMYKHQVQVYHEYLKRIVLVDKYRVSGFMVHFNGTDHLFKKEKYLKSKAKADSACFVEVLSTGNVALNKIYFEDVTPLASPERPFIDEFVPGVEYKLKVGNDFKNIRLKKSSLIRLFPQYKTQIKHYARKEKLKAKREADFTKMVVLVDALYSTDMKKSIDNSDK